MAEVMTMDEFQSAIADGVTLVDFWATWCGPCKMMLPIMEELKAELEGSAKVLKFDVDENQEISSAYGVRTLPAFFVFKDGDVVAPVHNPKKPSPMQSETHKDLKNV